MASPLQPRSANCRSRTHSPTARFRADGQFVHDMYLARVKTPAASSRRWDYFDIVATIPQRKRSATQRRRLRAGLAVMTPADGDEPPSAKILDSIVSEPSGRS